MQIFTTKGKHIIGTTISGDAWTTEAHKYKISSNDLISQVIDPSNGFNDGAQYDDSTLNNIGGDVSFTQGTAGNIISYNGMIIGYSGEGNPYGMTQLYGDPNEYLTIDEVTEDLILCLAGDGPLDLEASWAFMPTSAGTGGTTHGTPVATSAGDLISIKTQELAQKALERIDDAIVKKDNVRAHLGALQNRFENTITNLAVQAENLQASESRISDTDVATEMTEFVRNQILTQSATAMLAQANSLPQMLVGLIRG